MLNLLVAPNSTSSRKTRKWLREHHIAFRERDVVRDPLNEVELKQLLSLTENGCWDIMSTRSKAFKHLQLNIESLSLSQLIQLMIKEPSLVKHPLLYNENQLQVGFNEENIRSFLPREVRRRDMEMLLAKSS